MPAVPAPATAAPAPLAPPQHVYHPAAPAPSHPTTAHSRCHSPQPMEDQRCHDQPKNFIFPGPSGGTALVPYPTVAPTTPGILAPKNSITTLRVQPTCASPTPAPLSSIKEQPTFAIAALQPSHLIIPPDVQHSIRNPSPLYVDQYMSSPSPPIPDQAIFLGGDDDATVMIHPHFSLPLQPSLSPRQQHQHQHQYQQHRQHAQSRQ